LFCLNGSGVVILAVNLTSLSLSFLCWFSCKDW
jgi:hypothetical protein